ncbi:carbohydrate ABC transporter permease [Bacillus sp. 03113]|uniref:carbohydrate ABC transporter permease n=1 Tax=Bacillus sp. 03113 TaxID=2578211 RepID=UPI001142427B|nr:sugar ABC transporter permease [Bacillus sp. 03113]
MNVRNKLKPFKARYLFALPALVLFAVFFLYPFFNGFWLSLTNWDGFTKPRFIGVQNFIDFFKDERAMSAVKNTILFALFSAPLLNIAGLIYALLLENNRIKGVKLVRTLVYLPAIISPLIMAYIWTFIIQNDGFLPSLFLHMKLGFLVNDWLANPTSAWAWIIGINVWQFSGMTMVIYLSGLHGIPHEMYEAAEIDGAGYIRQLFSIKLPNLMPAITINVITNIIGSLAIFDAIVALTDGGPGYATESLSIYILRMVYGGSTGYAVAVAMVMFFITVIPVITYILLTKRKGLAI